MALNQPVTYNFPTHYKNDGLRAFTIALKFNTGVPIDLTGAKVRMQMRLLAISSLAWTFSTAGDGDSLLTIPIPTNGIIQFPEIKSWEIAAKKYEYDLEVTDDTGFVRTYLRGSWAVNQDITKKN